MRGNPPPANVRRLPSCCVLAAYRHRHDEPPLVPVRQLHLTMWKCFGIIALGLYAALAVVSGLAQGCR